MQFEHGYAVIIGVDENRVADLALPVTGRDVQAIYETLVHPQRCAYLPAHVRLLRRGDATRRNLLEALDWLGAQVAGNPLATTVVYFAGHGLRLKSQDAYYLIPSDIRGLDRLGSDGLRAEDFAAEIDGLQAKRLLLTLDCSHAIHSPAGAKELDLFSSPFPDDLPQIAAIPEYTAAPESTAAADLTEGWGRAFLTSASGEQQAHLRQDGRMSLFAYHLLEALAGHASHPTEAAVIDVTTVLSWVAREVQESASRQGVQQRPIARTSGAFPVAQLLGGRSVLQTQGAASPGQPQPSPEGSDEVSAPAGSGASARQERDERPAVSFNQQGQRVGGNVINFDEFQGNIGQIGDVIHGDRITVGDISNSSVALGRGASVINNMQASDTAKKELAQLVAQLDQLLQRAPAGQQRLGERVAEETKALLSSASSERPDTKKVKTLGERLQQTARALGDNLPGIIELTTQITAAVTMIARAAR